MEPIENQWCVEKETGKKLWIVEADDKVVEMAQGMGKPVSVRCTRDDWSLFYEMEHA